MVDREFRLDRVDHALPDHAEPCAPSDNAGCPSASRASTAGRPQPNTDATLEFLRLYSPGQSIVLTAILPDAKGPSTESETFTPGKDDDRARSWIDERQGIKNLYFTVNPTTRALSGQVKASKAQIRGMRALHVDLDPRRDADPERERGWTLDQIASLTPPPSFIIFSGGGHQGFWLLDKEQTTNGNEGKAAELEAYNQQLAVIIGADPCHNIDRIMRLPGTINIPGAKKQKRGRVPALAELVEYHPDRVYSLGEFTPAPTVQAKTERTGRGVKISGNLAKIDLDQLPDRVPKSVRQIIIQGEDPEDLTRFPSRSEALFFVCCELIRCGVDDDTIASIIMDPQFSISASVLARISHRIVCDGRWRGSSAWPGWSGAASGRIGHETVRAAGWQQWTQPAEVNGFEAHLLSAARRTWARANSV